MACRGSRKRRQAETVYTGENQEFLGTHFNSIVSPFQDVPKGLIAIVGVKLHEEGRTEGIGVSNEAEHSHRHLSQQLS